MLRRAARQILGTLGYEIHRRPNGAEAKLHGIPVPVLEPEAEYPRICHQKFQGIEYDFWVLDAMAASWYLADSKDYILEDQALAALVAPDDRILDVGCHHGIFLLRLAKLAGPQGFVVGVDINPESVLVAQAQIALNRLEGRCEVLHHAVSNNNQALDYVRDFTEAKVRSGNHAKRAGSAAAVTVDQLCERYGDFDMLMIDVEGFEQFVLEGAKSFISRRRPKLALEIHCNEIAKYGSSISSIIEAGNLADYSGTMVVRTQATPQSLPFDLANLPTTGIIATFLTPRG